MTGGAPDPQPRPGFGALAADAMRYWEPRRLLYNAALAAVVIIDVIVTWPGSKAALTQDNVLGLILLAVLANIAYCAAYAVDLFVQFSDLRSVWPKRRWIVLLTGIVFAGVIADFFTRGMLGSHSG